MSDQTTSDFRVVQVLLETLRTHFELAAPSKTTDVTTSVAFLKNSKHG